MARTVDVAIVGGGVIGSAIALYLAKRGFLCELFEQREFGWGASGATAGVVGPLWHVPHTHEAAMSLGLRSLREFPRLTGALAETGVSTGYRQSGILNVARTEADERALRDSLIWQGELGLGVRWVDRDELLELERHVAPGALGGVYSPQEGFVHGRSFVRAIAYAAANVFGARLAEGVEVGGLITEGDRVVGVQSSEGRLYADHVVLAAGPWSGLAGRWLPRGLPVRPAKGQRLLLRKPGFMPTMPVRDYGRYVMPQPDGSVLVAATRHEGEFDNRVTADAVGELLADAARAFPLLRDAEFAGAIAGVRPASPDGLPIIGPVPGREGLTIASGHDSAGVMLAPGTAELVADYLVSGDAAPLEPFGLSRFAADDG